MSPDKDKLSVRIVRKIQERRGVALLSAYAISLVIFFIAIIFIKDKSSLAISFSASLLEDIVFFSLIGIVIFIITMKDGKDEDIYIRLDNVINGSNLLKYKNAKNYFHGQTKQALAFYSRYKTTINIDEQNSHMKAYKIYTVSSGVIVNMCADIPFEDHTNVRAYPGVNVNGQNGEVTFYQIKDRISGDIVGEKIGKPIALKPTVGYSHNAKLFISANGKADYDYAFWLWSKYDQREKMFNLMIDRFASSYELEIQNSLKDNMSVYFEASLVKMNDESFATVSEILCKTKLLSGERIIIPNLDSLKPLDYIKIYFGPPVL